MKTLVLVGVMAFASAQDAFAIKAASSAEIAAIQKQIFVGNRMDADVKDAELKVVLAKTARESEGKILELKNALAREQDKQSAARTKAIHMTILAYGLKPASWSGKSVMTSTKDRTITWMPVARESAARQVQSADGALKDVKQDKEDYVGLTYPDGVTALPPKAFEKGPGYLASILLHERTHFEQFTTDGKGNKMSYAEAQKEAYKAQVDNGSYFFDEKNDKERATKKGIEGLLATEVIKVDDEIKASIEARKGLKGLVRRFLPPVAPPDIFEAKVHTNAELADISGLVARARAQADIASREREKREAIVRTAAEKSARRDHDEQLKKTIGVLALRSCANPGSVTQAELDGLPRPYDENFFYGKLPSGLEGADGTGYCTEPYFYMGRSTGDRLDAEELRILSTSMAPANAPIPERPIDARPLQPVLPVRVVAQIPFNTVFLGLKAFAVKACGTTNLVPVDKALTAPSRPFFFLKGVDDPITDNLASGLGYCEESLFRRLIDKIRNGHGGEITAQWVHDEAASYRSAAGAPSGYSRPQSDGGDPCRDHDNIRCP